MPMQMGFRWYGEGNDRIRLSDIRQIPGIVWALHHKLPGEVWEVEEIVQIQKQLDPYGFNMDVVESVNVHDDIKIGLPTRDRYIKNYRITMRNLSRFGVAEELIGATLFLCDDKAASAITGVVLPVDAGFAAYSGV